MSNLNPICSSAGVCSEEEALFWRQCLTLGFKLPSPSFLVHVQDIAMMAQNEVGEAVIAGGGKSSAMHHKANHVAAEILVALARYNAALLTGVHVALVHEQERSGAAWLLDWMTLPSMLETTGAALSHSADLLSRISFTSGAG